MKVSLTMIRPYHYDDIDAVVDAWRVASLLAHPFFEESFLDQEADNIRNVYLAFAETYVTEINGEVIGFIAMIDHEIGGLFLHPEHHGRGLGRAMVDHVRAKRQMLAVEVFKKTPSVADSTRAMVFSTSTRSFIRRPTNSSSNWHFQTSDKRERRYRRPKFNN